MNKIKTIARPVQRKVTGCGECRSTCQSACKTSCTVGNQSCERITRPAKQGGMPSCPCLCRKTRMTPRH